MDGHTMFQLGLFMVASSVVLGIVFNLIFAINKKKMIAKIYSEIEEK